MLINRLSASSLCSCSTLRCAVSAVSFSRAKRSAAAAVRSAIASLKAFTTKNVFKQNVARWLSSRMQSFSVICNRFNGFSNCFDFTTYSAKTGGSNRCFASGSSGGFWPCFFFWPFFLISRACAIVSPTALASSNGGYASSQSGSSVIGSQLLIVFHHRSSVVVAGDGFVEGVCCCFVSSFLFPGGCFFGSDFAPSGFGVRLAVSFPPPRLPFGAVVVGAGTATLGLGLAAGGRDRGMNGVLVARNAFSEEVGAARSDDDEAGTVSVSPRTWPPRPRPLGRPRGPGTRGPPGGAASPVILAPRDARARTEGDMTSEGRQSGQKNNWRFWHAGGCGEKAAGKSITSTLLED